MSEGGRKGTEATATRGDARDGRPSVASNKAVAVASQTSQPKLIWRMDEWMDGSTLPQLRREGAEDEWRG